MEEGEKPTLWMRFYNAEKGTFYGRTPIGWLLLLAFYVSFFVCLAAFWVALLALFYETLRNFQPKYFNDQSLLQENPGLGLRPMPVYDTTLIRFEQGKPSSFKPYTDHIEAYLFNYNDRLQQGRDLVECSMSDPDFVRNLDSACKIRLDEWLGKECIREKDYGYEDGRPCVLLKMNRVYNYTVDPYDSLEELKRDNGLKSTPRFLAFTPGLTVGVSCEGENAADRENLKSIKFYPTSNDMGFSGFPKAFYPYLNQEGYRSPFVMIQFESFTNRVIIQVKCTLYARNIDNSGTRRNHGSILFELLKD